MDRPKITDRREMDIIRKMYFEPATYRNAEIDPIEANDRLEHKNLINQAR